MAKYSKVTKGAIEAPQELVPDANVENVAPERSYSSFDSFFHEYALANGVKLTWKQSVKKHLEATDCLKDPKKWLSGIKHFGL